MNIVHAMDKLYIQLFKFIKYRVSRVSREEAKALFEKKTSYDGLK